MPKNAQKIDSHFEPGAQRTLKNRVDAKNDDLAGEQRLLPFLVETIAAGSSEIHFEQDTEVCRVRTRLDGHLDERRIESATLTEKLIAEISAINRPASRQGSPVYKEQSLRMTIGDSTCYLQYAFYPTVSGHNLSIQIHREDQVADTLDQTSLNAEQIRLLRAQTSKISQGITIICSRQTDLLQDVFYGLLGDINCVEKKIVSIEQTNKKRISRINHIALSSIENPVAVIRMATTHADQLLIDWQCTLNQPLIKHILMNHQAAVLFVKAPDTSSAIAQLTDFANSERQLANNLKTLIHLDNTRLVCPHCANAHELNGEEMKWMQDRSIGRRKNHALVYAPGCERCNYSGSQESSTLLCVCNAEDGLRRAIECRDTSAIVKATQAATGSQSIEDQIDCLVSAGKVSFTEYRSL